MGDRAPRRRPSFGSTSSLRRSSISQRDIEAIQQALRRQRAVSAHFVIAVLIFLPCFSFFLLYSIHIHQGELFATMGTLMSKWPFVLQMIPTCFDIVAWKIVCVLLCVQFILYEGLPHDYALVLSSADVPDFWFALSMLLWRQQSRCSCEKRESLFIVGNNSYCYWNVEKPSNAFSSTIIVCLMYVLGSLLGFYRADVVFIHFPSIVTVLAILALLITITLYAHYHITDRHFVTDSVTDIFFGFEMDAHVLDIELKHFLRSRITFGIYALFVISSLFYHHNLFNFVGKTLFCNATVHLVYIMVWLWGEELQMNGVDARRIKCGFGRIWGDLVLFPILYTSPVAIMASRRRQISIVFTSILSVCSVIFILFTYIASKERYTFRRYNGKMKIWGHDPYFITAKYRTDNGEMGSNLLLGSGYWGMSRHPNYMFEFGAQLCLTLAQGFCTPLCHLHFFFLTAYLLLRISYDEYRCLLKYGNVWSQHCSKVRFRFIPGLY